MRITQRAKALGLGVVALGAAVALAACGGGGGIEGGGSTEKVETVKYQPPPSGDLTVSNWPLYIDKNTVPNFEQATGVKVDYIEDVNDNQEFFAKMQPLLSQGQSGGRSIIVVTDWMAQKMHELGYVQNLDKAGLPNVTANLRDNLQHPDFDPNREYSVPWQSGMTGLIVNTQLAPNVHSINDLFDPQYKGKVEMLTELRDTVPLVMKADGIDPNKATEQDWLDTIDKLKQAVSSGQIRRFTGNDYTRDMANGDVAAIIGWSGDAVQLQADNPNIEFRMPTEGCILWSDNMEIPVGAPNPTAAEAFMNYVYDPKNQAPLAAYNSYVTPVDGVREVFRTSNPDLVNDPLIFPTDEFTAKCSTQPNLTGQEEQTVTRAFEGVLNG
ncbi:MAG TPA: spermidine/putrescine ABC transporter substrate-binding protein [Solirubrobacterales bacterium]|nr:spermidine/putrescine ABC transporter substrate-binding protein [Solirubrobacterales bacterium]